MAIRLTSASSQYLQRTASLPSATAYTACGWTSRASNAAWGTLVALENGGAGTYFNLQMNDTSTGLTLFSTGGSDLSCGTKALNTPFFFCVTSAGTAAGDVKVYIRAATSNVLEVFTLSGGWAGLTPNVIRYGSDQFNEYYDGSFWNAKCWDRALTPAEVLVESFYRRVMFPASLNFHWPLDNATNLTSIDISGNARPPTLGGTPTAADGSHGLWVPRRRIFLPTAAGGGDVSVSLTGSALTSAAGSMGPDSAKALSGNTLASALGTLVPASSKALTGSALTFGQGSVSAGGDVTLALTGQALTVARGTLLPAFSIGLTGQAASSALGTLASAVSKAISGSALAIAGGAVSPAVAAALSGSLLTIGQGAVSAPGNITLQLTGQALTAAQGAFVLSLAKAISGSSAATSAGSVVAAPSKALTGTALTSSAGSFGVGISASLTGSLASLTQGTVFSASGGIVSDLRVTYTASLEPSTFDARHEQESFSASAEPQVFTAKKTIH